MMPTITDLAGLSRKYSNPCVTATAITLWSDHDIPSHHIMNISGHKNEQSLAHYNCRPTFTQLEVCSDVFAITINKGTHHKLQMDSFTASTDGITPTASEVSPPFQVQPMIQSSWRIEWLCFPPDFLWVQLRQYYFQHFKSLGKSFAMLFA